MSHYDQWRYGGGAGRGNPQGGSEQRTEDEHLQRAVRWSLFEDTWLDARNIDIAVRDGVVTLSGKVRDYMAMRYAWDDAWETPGVRGVITKLDVGQSP